MGGVTLSSLSITLVCHAPFRPAGGGIVHNDMHGFCGLGGSWEPPWGHRESMRTPHRNALSPTPAKGCPKIINFWIAIQREIKNLFGITIRLDPYDCVLGLDSEYGTGDKYILRIALYAARLTILQKWLDEDPPDIKMWYDKLMSILPLERLSHVLRGTLEQFVRNWSPLSTLLKEEWLNVISLGVTNT